MALLSVNVNKFALIRNSRGQNQPDVQLIAQDCERFGAGGITLHPRPDQRHARYEDIHLLKKVIRGELNVEGYPSRLWLDEVIRAQPTQCTLVPDAPDALTSNEGWDTVKHTVYLRDMIQELKFHGIRVSIFVDPIEQMVEGAHAAGADRIELYTGPYAKNYPKHPEKAVEKYANAARFATRLGLGVNAGHDLNLQNVGFFLKSVPQTSEVSIGHAIICDALIYGLENTIRMYAQAITKG